VRHLCWESCLHTIPVNEKAQGRPSQKQHLSSPSGLRYHCCCCYWLVPCVISTPGT
jgi:hypothetical protein